MQKYASKFITIDKRTFTGSVEMVKAEDMATAGIGDVGKAL